MVGDKIHSRSFRVLAFQVDGWRQYLIPKRQHGNSRLEPARTTEKMACHRLGGADGNFVLSEEIADGMSFERIADRGRCAVRVHVTDDIRTEARIADGIAH